MATQQILFAETIAGMKKAFKRKAYESDSDSEIASYGNRGHKLKRKARFAHRGQLVPTDGPSTYKETVDYAGSRRSIISRNPPLIDEDGYNVDSEDDDERVENAIASAAELNPYANIRLEHILAPLTASTDLPTHITVSKPFTSQNLTELVLQSAQMMRRENHSLWQVRHLWTALCGDYTWAPCETMIGPSDIDLYTDDHVARHLLTLSKLSDGTYSATAATVNGEAPHEPAAAGDSTSGSKIEAQNSTGDANEQEDVSMTEADADDPEGGNSKEEKRAEPNDAGLRTQPSGKSGGKTSEPNASGSVGVPQSNGEPSEKERDNNDQADSGDRHQDSAPVVGAPSVTSDATEQPFIHPMFLPPTTAKPDRDVGIPEQEAEDIRRLLSLFVQKQEEVCRGINKLYDGLNKAQRLRQDVLHWSKAEAHSGVNRDMSDGEDWYDKEEWGLTEDLKKGQDDEEEDTTTATKKTRNRR